MLRPPSSPFHRLPRGGISWVTALLILLVIGGGYLGWVYVPVYLLHLEVRQVTRRFMNEAVKNRNDEQLVQKMVHKLRTLEQQEVVDEDGSVVEIPTVNVEPQGVTWERDTQSTPPMLHVAFEYTRVVSYPLLGRSAEQTLSVDLVEDLSMPDWGPAQ